MKLGIRDRIRLLGLLPSEGDIRTLKTITTLRDALLFNEEEVKKFGIVVSDGQAQWASSEDVEIAIGDIGTEIIVAQLRQLETEKKLTLELMPLWEAFVEQGNATP